MSVSALNNIYLKPRAYTMLSQLHSWKFKTEFVKQRRIRGRRGQEGAQDKVKLEGCCMLHTVNDSSGLRSC